MTISLRDYQERAKVAVRAEMAAGRRRVVLVLPTGAGKTRVGASVCEDAVARGNPVVWLAHRSELVEQAASTIEGHGLRVGVIAAQSKRRPDPGAPIQVASIQTLVARPDQRPPCKLMIPDECHHLSSDAEVWTALVREYPGVALLGLTATPETGRGAGLRDMFDALVTGATVRELTALWQSDSTQGLVPCRVIRPDKLLDPGQIAQGPVDAYCDHAPGRQAILFARNVEEARRYAGEFAARGVRAECVTGDTPDADRDAALQLFRRGVVRVLCNVYVMTEGTDLPMAEVVILARGAGSAGIYLQMTGRGLRPWPGKTECLLIDLRGVSHHPQIGLPDDERAFSLDGRGISLVKGDARCAVCKELLEGGSYPCPRCQYEPTSGEGAGETTVVGMPLSAARRWGGAADEQQRTRTLLKWVREALARGHKPTIARHKWRGTFGDELSATRLQWAIEEVRRAG